MSEKIETFLKLPNSLCQGDYYKAIALLALEPSCLPIRGPAVVPVWISGWSTFSKKINRHQLLRKNVLRSFAVVSNSYGSAGN